ncbi:MAG: ATP-binding protein [Pseudomonadota bacterium]
MWSRDSLLVRLILGAAIWCGLALIVSGFLLVSLFRQHLESRFDSGLGDHLIHLVSIARPGEDGAIRVSGTLSGALFNRPFSGWAWQVRQGELVLAQSVSLGPARPGVAEILEAPLGSVGTFDGPAGIRSRGLAREVRLAEAAPPLIYSVARPVAEIDRALGQFRRTVVIAQLILGIGLVVAVLYLMQTSLKPLDALRRKVARMREGLPRQEDRWPRELAPVAEELDALQDHVERLVERGRGEAADLAHAVKTPLAVLSQLSIGANAEDAETMRRQIDRIEAYLNRHLSRSRSSGLTNQRVDVAACVADLLFAMQTELQARDVAIMVEIPAELRFLGDESDLFEILGNVLDNARKWTATQIRVTAWLAEGGLVVAVADDGPGVAPEQRDEIFARGTRLDEATPGAGLGLTIVREILLLYGGQVEISASDLGGALLTLTLPGLVETGRVAHKMERQA